MLQLLHALREGIRTGSARLFVRTVQEFRDSFLLPESAQAEFGRMLARLRTHPELLGLVRQYLAAVLHRYEATPLLTDAGILSSREFVPELLRRLTEKVLPDTTRRPTLETVLREAFRGRLDFRWMQLVPTEQWLELFSLVLPREELARPDAQSLRAQVLGAVNVLSYRIAAIGLEPELVRRHPQLTHENSPWLHQNREILQLLDGLAGNPTPDGPTEDYRQVLVLLRQCEESLEVIAETRTVFGTSVRLITLQERLRQHVHRLRQLLAILHEPAPDRQNALLLTLFLDLVRGLDEAESIRALFTQSTRQLAHQVVEHAGRTGEHYITRTAREYWQAFVAALGGGLYVALAVPVKILIYWLHGPLGPSALLYSLNYAAVFVGVHLSHFSIATKQPAMTASHIAASLDAGNGGPPGHARRERLARLADLIVCTSRSQFISFVGNLLLCIPLPLLFGWAWLHFTGQPFIDGEKAHHLLEEIHPWHSLSVFYAGIAGLGLFGAGLISGYFDNKVAYLQLPLRLKRHRGLRRLLPARRLIRFANYVGNNLGAMMGNILLGFYLGSMGTLGVIFGLPLDIRHITFSSGNFGLAVASLGFDVPLAVVGICLLGIFLIGLMNFAVSFALSLFVATRARGLQFREAPMLVQMLVRLFFRWPQDWLFAPRTPRDLAFLTAPR